MTTRILCVGNRLIAEDSAGPQVHDRLSEMSLPPSIEVIDGGLAGLDLLPFFEGTHRVVLVDSVRGFAAPGEVVVLEAGDVLSAVDRRYDHAGGLGYLLRVLPHVLSPVPELTLVGIESPHKGAAIDEAAREALFICTSAESTKPSPISPVPESP